MIQQSIHVWAGISNKSEEQFYKYFDQSKFLKESKRVNSEESDSGKSMDYNLRCQFAKDLNLPYSYDPEWITIYWDRRKTNIQTVIEELPVWGDQTEVEIYHACIEKGVSEANAIFSYAANELTIEKPLESYNGLIYIGCFANNAR